MVFVLGGGKVELWFVVVGGGKVELWDLETVQSVQSLHAHDEAVTCITVSRHSMYRAVYTTSGTLF